MNTILYICLGILTITSGAVMYRIIFGPSESDRAAASDMLLATTVSIFIVFGLLLDFSSMIDLLLIVSAAGFLATLAMVRLILRDEQ